MKHFAWGLLALVVTPVMAGAVAWRDVLRQSAAWYATGEAQAIADHIVLHQQPTGGWPKNRDMTAPPVPSAGSSASADAPTIDNGATWTQVRYLARVHAAAPKVAVKEAVQRGLDYLLAAQYANGGWPQYFPLRRGYYTHITFNDDAMVRVLELLQDVSAGASEFVWVDASRRASAAEALRRGVDCIVRCQIIIDGAKTAWCAQHDETTLAPVPARRFEPAALSGSESVGIVRFLMSLDTPSPEIIAAVHAAIVWFERVQLTGIRVTTPADPKLPHGHDCVVVADPTAPPLWARFYELGTNRPIFAGRDAVIRYALAEIEAERRGGYNWYTGEPAKLLEREYPQWRRLHGLP